MCCDVHHPYSTSCNPPEVPDTPPTKQPTLDAPDVLNNSPPSKQTTPTVFYDSEYEMVPIKFSVSGMPDVVNMRELKAEMLLVLKRVLTDLMEKVQDLKITNVEENLLLTMMPQNRRNAAQNGDYDVYYDVTVVRQPNKKFGPIIIAGLRDSYDVIIQEIEDCTNMKYFYYGVDLNWCTDNSGEQTFGVCSRTDERVLVKFRLANLPAELNLQNLIRQVIGFYKAILGGVEKLEIIDIEQQKVVDLSDGGDTAQDVFLDIVAVRKFDVADFGPAINDKLQSSKSDVLNRIQSYTDTSTDLDLNWCLNGDGAYAVCPQPHDSRFSLPNWAIITLTVVSVVLSSCICWCILAYMKQRDEFKNERNMVSYIHTGQNYNKERRPNRPPQPPRRRDRPMLQSHRPRDLRPPQYHETRSIRRLEEEEPPQHLMLTNDTTYLENMPSFVFDNGNGRPPPQLMLANGEDYVEDLSSKPDPDGEHESDVILEGPWFVDEESVLPPPRTRICNFG